LGEGWENTWVSCLYIEELLVCTSLFNYYYYYLEEGNLDKICTINLFLTPFPYNKIPFPFPYNKIPFLLIIEPFHVHFEELFSKNKYPTPTNQKYVKQNPMIKLGFPIEFF
jgi:hypothetical protein